MTVSAGHRIFTTTLASVYPLYLSQGREEGPHEGRARCRDPLADGVRPVRAGPAPRRRHDLRGLLRRGAHEPRHRAASPASSAGCASSPSRTRSCSRSATSTSWWTSLRRVGRWPRCCGADGDRGRRRSAFGSPAQALQLAPQALARPALPSDERDRWPGLPNDGWAVVHVAGRGDGGPDTRLDRPQDLDDALAIGDERLDPITRSNLRRRLRRRSIHEDVATVAQPGRERAGLHEAHRAQPAIDPRLVGGEGISHASELTAECLTRRRAGAGRDRRGRDPLERRRPGVGTAGLRECRVRVDRG